MTKPKDESRARKIFGTLLSWGVPKKRPKDLGEAEELARGMLRNYLYVSVGTSFVPGCTFYLGLMDTKLYADIAKIYQIPDFNVDAIVSAVVASGVGRGVAEVVGWLTGVAPITNPIVAATVTKKLADFIIGYMEPRSPLPKAVATTTL